MTRTTLALAGLLLPASAPQTPPDPPSSAGCAVALPDPSANGRPSSAVPRSACDPDGPVAYGGSVWDGMGRRR